MNTLTEESLANALVRTVNEQCGKDPVDAGLVLKACLLVAGKVALHGEIKDAVHILGALYDALDEELDDEQDQIN